jgi:hypothetical protein
MTSSNTASWGLPLPRSSSISLSSAGFIGRHADGAPGGSTASALHRRPRLPSLLLEPARGRLGALRGTFRGTHPGDDSSAFEFRPFHLPLAGQYVAIRRIPSGMCRAIAAQSAQATLRDRAHSPKVVGSNPASATKCQRTMIPPFAPSPAEAAGFSFWASKSAAGGRRHLSRPSNERAPRARSRSSLRWCASGCACARPRWAPSARRFRAASWQPI